VCVRVVAFGCVFVLIILVRVRRTHGLSLVLREVDSFYFVCLCISVIWLLVFVCFWVSFVRVIMYGVVRTPLRAKWVYPRGVGERGGGAGDKAGGANPIGIW